MYSVRCHWLFQAIFLWKVLVENSPCRQWFCTSQKEIRPATYQVKPLKLEIVYGETKSITLEKSHRKVILIQWTETLNILLQILYESVLSNLENNLKRKSLGFKEWATL